MGTINFDKKSPLGEELEKQRLDWQEHKGDRAAFCRAKGVSEIVLLPEFHYSLRRFKRFFSKERYWEERIAAVLGLLSHVRETENKSLAKQMAGDGETPLVSKLRFRRLIQRNRREDLYAPLIRVLRMLKKRADPHDLANSVYYWGDKYWGDKIKKDWAYDYFSNIKTKK